MIPSFGNPAYAITRNLGKHDFTQTRQAVEAALKTQGLLIAWGVFSD